MTMRRLARVFDSGASSRSGLPIRKTCSGIWVPTPVSVVDSAIRTLQEMGYLGEGAPPGHVIDAGAGDGRVSAMVAAVDPTRTVYGIEVDPILYAQAVANLERLDASRLLDASEVHLIEGDYCDAAIYQARGVVFGQTHLVLNYPDGNERRLASFVAERFDPDTRLCLLTHDRTLEIQELSLLDRRDVTVPREQPWQLSLYGRVAPPNENLVPRGGAASHSGRNVLSSCPADKNTMTSLECPLAHSPGPGGNR